MFLPTEFFRLKAVDKRTVEPRLGRLNPILNESSLPPGRVIPHGRGKRSKVNLWHMKTNLRFDFFREVRFRLKRRGGPVDRIMIGLGIALLTVSTGCVGWVDGGGYGGTVVVPGPEVSFFGGVSERGREVRDYSHRGAVSRGVAHPGGERGGRR